MKEIQKPTLKEEIHLAESLDIGDINLVASCVEQKEELLKVTKDPVILQGRVDDQEVREIYLDPGS